MLSIRTFSFALVAAGLLAACSESTPPATTAAAPAPAPAPATPAATPAAEPAPAPVATSVEPVATAAPVTGVAECDAFLAAYEACLTAKIPEASRAAMQSGLDQMKSSWKSLAENDATKASLPQVCKQSQDATAQAMQAYGCTF